MSDPIVTEQVVAAGYFGLNTQESSVTLPNSYALVLDNAVIDSSGRVGARKGLEKTSMTSYTGLVGCIHESVSTNGVKDIISVASRSFYKGMPLNVLKFTHPTTTVTRNWTAVNLNNHAYFFQRGVAPVVYNIATDVIQLIENHPNYAGTVPKANAVLSAFGRLWVGDTDTNKNILYYSDTLIGHKWTGGSAGSIDLTTVFPNGGDEIVSIAAFNNRLVIFARKSIIIYTGASNPSTMVVEDSIDTLGCIARDSIQDTGDDIIFMSDSGLKSLGRVVQERSNPINDLSINVKDMFVSEVLTENLEDVRSVYYEKDNFYLLSLPTSSRVWCFDTRQKLENGALRATTWSEITLYSMLATANRTLLVGDKDSEVSSYTNYSMKGFDYEFTYMSNYLNSGDSSITKILKKVSLILVGGAKTLTVRYGTNYTSSLSAVNANVKVDKQASEYGISEYGIAEYNTGGTTQIVESTIGGSGSVYQIGVSAKIDGSPLSVQQLNVKFKKGRTF